MYYRPRSLNKDPTGGTGIRHEFLEVTTEMQTVTIERSRELGIIVQFTFDDPRKVRLFQMGRVKNWIYDEHEDINVTGRRGRCG